MQSRTGTTVQQCTGLHDFYPTAVHQTHNCVCMLVSRAQLTVKSAHLTAVAVLLALCVCVQSVCEWDPAGPKGEPKGGWQANAWRKGLT